MDPDARIGTYRRTSLDTVVHPAGPKLVLIQRNRRGLTSTAVSPFEYGDLESVGMLCQRGGAGHACCAGANDHHMFLACFLWGHVGSVQCIGREEHSMQFVKNGHGDRVKRAMSPFWRGHAHGRH